MLKVEPNFALVDQSSIFVVRFARNWDDSRPCWECLQIEPQIAGRFEAEDSVPGQILGPNLGLDRSVNVLSLSRIETNPRWIRPIFAIKERGPSLYRTRFRAKNTHKSHPDVPQETQHCPTH